MKTLLLGNGMFTLKVSEALSSRSKGCGQEMTVGASMEATLGVKINRTQEGTSKYIFPRELLLRQLDINMTVSYTLEVANAEFGGFSKLLFRFLLTAKQQDLFERVALYCDQFTNTNYIPVLFVLGFYVTQAFNRWWGQYTSFPLPDNLMMVVSGNVHGADERGRLLRRTLMRYANLSSVLILRSISTRVHKRFPTLEHVVEAGFMTTHELKKFESLHSDFNKYWMPLTWFSNLASRAREEGRVRDDIALRLLMDELNKYRAKCSLLFHYDWISIPLVYTQVGELIINPFGEDDDDFETNQLIDRNIQVSMLAVDDMYQNLAQIVKDKHWEQRHFSIPYTLSTAAEIMKPAFKGSTFDMRMSAEDLEIHQPADTAEKKQFLPLKDNGLDSLLQRGKGVLRVGSLPSLMNISSHPNGEEDGEEDISATSREQKKTLINVAVDHN
ncbi:hypothetical protein Q8A73_015448 [Channa argus]|nr:hypothetical protein Q8A73_015448 [Channa argus]